MHSLKFIPISFHVFHIMISHMFGMFVFVSYHLGFQIGMGTDMRTVYLISISFKAFSDAKSPRITKALEIFDLTLVDCWANLYRSQDDIKSWHHDNYQDWTPRPPII